MATEGYLLDTTVASWLWDGGNRNHESARSRFAALPDAIFFVSSITTGEVQYGLDIALAMDSGRKTAVRTAMAGFEVLPIDRHSGQTYGGIRAALFATHAPGPSRGRMQMKVPEDLIDSTTGKSLGVQENDIWIVAVAVQYGLRFVTGDRAGGMRHVLLAANALQQAEFWIP